MSTNVSGVSGVSGVRPRIHMAPIMMSAKQGREGLVKGAPYPTFRSYVVETVHKVGLTSSDALKIDNALRFSMAERFGGKCSSCSGAV